MIDENILNLLSWAIPGVLVLVLIWLLIRLDRYCDEIERAYRDSDDE